MRNIQSYHIRIDYGDIGYNFLVGGDGSIYVGQGWDNKGAHTFGYNAKSVCIAFMGDFTVDQATPEMFNATRLLLEEGVRRYMLDKDYKLYGHRDLRAFESPGETVYKVIQGWPHYTSIA